MSEFCASTGYHRKYSIGLLNEPRSEKRRTQPQRWRGLSYNREALTLLTKAREAAGYPWSVLLKVLLPLCPPWGSPSTIGCGQRQLLKICVRQMDRRLKDQKTQRRRRIYGRTKPGYLVKHYIPVKTDRRGVASTGFTEVDLVSYSGISATGELVHALNVTDIHTTWMESRAVLGREEEAVKRASNEIAGVLPFALLGVDSDNGSELINWHLQGWCERKQIPLTRGRPYKKDDNAHIEQKSRRHVRKLLGWDRYDTCEATEGIKDLCRHELRLWLNLYLPSMKLVKKVRMGSKVRRIHGGPRTPFERVKACPQATPKKVARLEQWRKTLDPFQLRRIIEHKLECISRLTNRRLSPKTVQQTVTEPTQHTRRAKSCG